MLSCTGFKNPRLLRNSDAGIGVTHGLTGCGYPAGGCVCGSRGLGKQHPERGERGLGTAESNFRRSTELMLLPGGHILLSDPLVLDDGNGPRTFLFDTCVSFFFKSIIAGVGYQRVGVPKDYEQLMQPEGQRGG